jgi:hypothetical protein
MAANEGRCALLCGDFNSDLMVGDRHLDELVIDCELHNALVGDKATFTSGSGDSAVATTIDHVLYRGLGLRTLGGQPVPINQHSQDHKAVLARFAVGGGACSSVAPKLLVLRKDLPIGNPTVKQLFIEGLNEVGRMDGETPEATIVRITNGSVRLTAKLAGHKAGRRYKDGWSPKMRVLQLNLQMLISMRRQLRGEDGCVATFNGKFKRGFKRIRNRWRSALHGICAGSEEEKAAQLAEYKGYGRYAFAFWEYHSNTGGQH